MEQTAGRSAADRPNPATVSAPIVTRRGELRSRLVEGLAATAPVMTALIGLLAFRPSAEAAEGSPEAGDGGGATGGSGLGFGGGPGGGGSGGMAGAASGAGAATAAGGFGLSLGLIGSAAAGELDLAGGAVDPRLALSTTGPGGTGAQAGAAGGAAGGGGGPTSISVSGLEAAAVTAPLYGDVILEDGSAAAPIGNVIHGTDGDDVIDGTDQADNIDGGAGDDTIRGGAGDDTLGGGDGNDGISGGDGDDTIDGGSGDDALGGDAGDDVIGGGTGDDTLYGGSGDDSLDGGSGDDHLDGDSGDDAMQGGYGDDVLVVHNHTDFASDVNYGPNGGGIDTVVVAADYTANFKAELDWLVPDGLVTFRLGDILDDSGNYVAIPDSANWYGQMIQNDIENIRLEGTDAHDVLGDSRDNEIYGNAADNMLFGEGGHDTIHGGAGDDILHGGEGDDILAGNDGDDMLYGDAGDDTFLVGLSDSGVDTIFDHQGVNTVQIDGADPIKLSARYEGNDLHLAHDGSDVAVIKDYVGHESAFTGVSTGADTISMSDILSGAAAGAQTLAGTFAANLAAGSEAAPSGAAAEAPLLKLFDASLSAEALGSVDDPWGAVADGGAPVHSDAEAWLAQAQKQPVPAA